LGRRTSASFLDVDADISVHAKLLTGGLIPLATTLASKDIFDAFSSPEKSDALLHGHSYTAHAVGCKVADASVKTMMGMEEEGYWDGFKTSWRPSSSGQSIHSGEGVWSSWSADLVRDLSLTGSVESVFAVGSVLSITLRDRSGGGMFHFPVSIVMDITNCGATGYTSTAAKGLQQQLSLGSTEGGLNFNVHSRVLGNVLYLMASMTSKPESLKEIEGLLRSVLV
jgi:dethiobiotin synthetase/adenosylmethionine--8-amino-7-oxononanoate aminotransferase